MATEGEASNAGWNDEEERFGLSHSRAELIQLALEDAPAFPARRRELPTLCANSTPLDELSASLQEHGAVKIAGLFQDATLAKMAVACSEALRLAESMPALSGGEGIKSAAISDPGSHLGLSFVTRHSPARWDLFPASAVLVPELESLEGDAFHPTLRRLLDRHMKCCGWKKDADGFLPVLPSAEPGRWHRDTRALFAWDEGEGDADRCDGLDQQVPDYYFTLIVALDDLDSGACDTEFIQGSHTRSIRASLADATLLSTRARRGDAVLFNGKCLHRGGANSSLHETRLAAYFTFTAKWYADA